MMKKYHQIVIVFFYSLLILCKPVYADEPLPPTETPQQQNWAYSGLFGQYDKEQLRRGLQVYQEKCQACHSLNYLGFHQLTDVGGPELSIDKARSIAAENVFPAINDMGEIIERPGTLADHFPSPFANTQEAIYLNNGKEPVDLTYITRARGYDRGFPQSLFDMFTPYTDQGSDYVFALLTGYSDAIPETETTAFNRYFPGGMILMPKQLNDGDIEYPIDATGKKAPETAEQYARDVTAFLAWTADPYLESRKNTGWIVLGYFTVFLVLLLALNAQRKKIQRAKEHQ